VGLFGAYCTPEGSLLAVDVCKNVDITVGRAGSLHCKIVGFFEDERALFARADVVVVERQPFQSAGFPLELILRERWGSKLQFRAPNSLHKEFCLGTLDYNGRKDRVVAMVQEYLVLWASRGIPGAREAQISLASFDRKHDCCDGALLYLSLTRTLGEKKAEVAEESAVHEVATPAAADFGEFVAQYRYAPRSRLVSRFFARG